MTIRVQGSYAKCVCHKPQGLIWLLHVWRSRSIPDQPSVHSVAATATGSIHLIKMKAELLRLWSERSEHNCTADLSTYCCRNRIIMVLTTGIRRAKSPTLEWLDAEMGDPASAYQNDYLESMSLLVVMTVATRVLQFWHRYWEKWEHTIFKDELLMVFTFQIWTLVCNTFVYGRFGYQRPFAFVDEY